MRAGIFLTFITCMLISSPGVSQSFNESNIGFKWDELPPLPDKFGFAGAFAGVSNGALIVAGGANFPDGGAPWTGSKKVWSDKIFALDRPGKKWKEVGRLPKPLGYGVSVECDGKIICVGGSNADGHSSAVFSINYDDERVIFESLPSLPQPVANSSGAILDSVIYIAGGLFKPESTSAAGVFWTLDLSHKNEHSWKSLETWPGEPRMLAVTGAQGGSFFLFSGTNLESIDGAAPQRKYLKDAYQFTPGMGWKQLADLPSAVVAAPSPAYADKRSNLMIFGGDDGEFAPQAAKLKERHPGFSNRILKYNVFLNKWSVVGKVKTHRKSDADLNPNGSVWAPVTTSFVLWKGKLIFPSGEVRPAVRTPRILVAKPDR